MWLTRWRHNKISKTVPSATSLSQCLSISTFHPLTIRWTIPWKGLSQDPNLFTSPFLRHLEVLAATVIKQTPHPLLFRYIVVSFSWMCFHVVIYILHRLCSKDFGGRQIYYNHYLYNMTILQLKMHHTMTTEDNDNRKVMNPPPHQYRTGKIYTVLRKGYFIGGEGEGQALADRYQAVKIHHPGRQYVNCCYCISVK
jgi:hypothetical protein